MTAANTQILSDFQSCTLKQINNFVTLPSMLDNFWRVNVSSQVKIIHTSKFKCATIEKNSSTIRLPGRIKLTPLRDQRNVLSTGLQMKTHLAFWVLPCLVACKLHSSPYLCSVFHVREILSHKHIYNHQHSLRTVHSRNSIWDHIH